MLCAVVFVASCPTVGGTTGSRWKMPVSGFTPVLGCAPTAHPSVGFVVKTEYKPNPEVIGPGIGTSLHPAPPHHAVKAFPVLLSKPTAHPSPPPAVVPYVSTCTDLQTVEEGSPVEPPNVQSPPLFVVVMIVLLDPTIHP